MKKNYTLLLIVSFLFLNSNAQWVKTNGPEGIYITSFFEDGNVLLCGTYTQGVYRSSDNGNSWMVSNSGLENHRVECFAKDSLYIYAGTFGQGVYRSSDNGQTWTPANIGIQSRAVVCLLSAAGYLFAGTGTGVFRSADQGNSWVDINDNTLNGSFIHSMVYNAPRLTVAVDDYLLYSFTQGGNWYFDMGVTAFYSITDFFQHGDTLLATTGNALFRSTNGGASWNGPTILSHVILGFDHINDTVYAGTPDGIYSSTDFGQTWAFTTGTNLRQGGAAPYGFIISGNNFLLGYDEIGVYKSQDYGVTWQQTPLNDFDAASNIDDAMIFDNGIIYTGTHYDGVYKTSDQGNTWTKIGTGNNLDTLSNEIVFDVLPVGPNIVLAGGCGDGLFRSADNGNTWTHITNGLPAGNGNFTCIKTLAQAGQNILCATIKGVFYSVDSGLTWLPTNLDSTMVSSASGFAVRGNIVCVGVAGNPFPNGIYRSTDYGVTWTLIGITQEEIETMATGGGQTMYAGSDTQFSAYVSHDDGLTWSWISLGSAFTFLAWDNYCFIGNDNGVFYSNDYGASFAFANQGFDPYPFNAAVQGLTRDSTYIYAGTFYDGVWRRPLSDFGVTGTVPAAGNSSAVFDVYPSVTSSECTITYMLARSSDVVIELMDYTGKLVTPIVNENKPAGTFTVTAKTENISQGIYLLRMRVNGKLYSSKKLVVTK